MIGWQRVLGDRARPPEKLLGVVRLVRDLAHDAEVVERVGEIGVERTEALLLQLSRFAQEPFRGYVISAAGGLFCRLEDGSRFAGVRHEGLQ